MRTITIAATFALFVTSAMAQEVGKPITVEGWTIARVAGAGVEFCAAAIKAPDNKTAFAFGVMSEKRSLINLTDASLSLKDDEEQPLSIRIDDGPAVEVMAYSDAKVNLMYAYPDVPSVGPLMKAAMAGKTIHVKTGEKTYDFPLAGAAAAIEALATCGHAIGAM